MNILMSISIYVIIVAMKQAVSDTCIGEYCFTTPGSNELRNFDGAKSWCTNNKSDLAVVNNSDVQLALTQFLKSSNTSAMTFINIKLLNQEVNTWFLVNGSRYNGYIGNQDPRESGYRLYCYLQPYGNRFQVDASKPSEMNRYICEFEDTRCLNYSTNILYSGRCYVKYENDSLTWYQARERCINSGGDLATFQNQPNVGSPPFDTSWLNPSLTYWVGIRWNDWRWKSPDGGNEAIYTSWSMTKPNNYDYKCVCVDPDGNPAWSWTDCRCEDSKQFVCLKIVHTTTTSTTTTTTTRTPTISTNSEVIAGSNSTSTSNALAIGLGAGLGGGLFLIVLVVLVVVVVMRKRRRNNNGVEYRHKLENTTAATTPNIELATSNGTDLYAHIVPTNHHPANDKPTNEVIYQQPEFSNNQNSASSGSDPTNIRQGRVQSVMLERSTDVYANATSAS